MQQVIWKYPLSPQRIVTHMVPCDAQFLTVQTQNGQPQIWMLVQPDAQQEPRRFTVIPTGVPFDSADDFPTTPIYRGTFQLDIGALVFHLFELVRS